MRIRKLIIILVGSIFTFFVIKLIFTFIKFTPCYYIPIIGHDNRYHYLFRKESISEIEKYYSFGNKRDAVFAYRDRTAGLRYIIKEIAAYREVDQNKISYKSNNDINLVHFSPNDSEDFEDKPALTIESSICHSKTPSLKVQLNRLCKVDTIIDGDNYRAYFGDFNKFGLIDETGNYQFIFNYKENLPVCSLLLFVHKRGSFHIIMVNSTKGSKVENNVLQKFSLESE